jgi:alpha-tubulin suppressor-like RCC1 family protein
MCAMVRILFVAIALLAVIHPAWAATPLSASAAASGGYHVCAVSGGAVKCWGNNAYGQLGTGDTYDRGAPVTVQGAESGATAVTGGLFHTCALIGGGVKCWGRNPDGEVGNGGLTDVYTAVSVQTLGSGVSAIAAGFYHTCAIVGGAVKCWGWNSNGQLGNGTNTATNAGSPVTVSGISNATAITAGGYHTCALAGGVVKCWGYNADGELDRGASGDSFTPVSAVGLTSGVTQIAAGSYHTCAVISGGALRCWGWNSDGQLGNGSTTFTGNNPPVTPTGMTAGVTAIAGGGYHTCASVGGAVKCWGDNYYGQLGNNSYLSKTTPVAVSGLSGITALTAGQYISCGLGGTTLHCWGENYDSQLGLGDSVYAPAPTAVAGTSGATRIARGPAASHTCAVIGGAAKCWGYAEDGELGNGSTLSSSTPVAVSGLGSGVTDIGVGLDFSCALLSSGAVKCWGGNSDGDLGNGSTVLSNVPVTTIASGASAIAVAYFHACAIVGTGVKCWGFNGDGELGDGSTTQRESPVAVAGLAGTPVSISAGVAHTCVALSNGKIQCWGYNSNGQLGNGNTTSTQANPPVTVSGISSGAGQVAAGGYHTCAIVGGAAQCWGYGQHGELGNGGLADSSVPVAVSGWTSNVQVLAGGFDQTCGVRSGAAYCWGPNHNGQRGTGGSADVSVPTAVTGLDAGVTGIGAYNGSTCAVVNGSVSCWGVDYYGQIGDGRVVQAPTPQTVVLADAIFADDFEG